MTIVSFFFLVKCTPCVALHGKQVHTLDHLKQIIYEEAESYTIRSKKVMGRQIPASYHALESHLVQVRKDVFQNKRSPIMHASEFREMLGSLNLTDISTAEEVRAVSLFLHEVGSLLHYDDRKNNLDDVYILDPHWLCDMMSVMVTVKERNTLIKNGIMERSCLPLLYHGKHFPAEFLDQYLVLLDCFEIALPLDQAMNRILIPSMLPNIRPDGTGRPSNQVCHERQVLFPVPTPPGFWSRLLARVIHTVQCLEDIVEASHGTNVVDWLQPVLHARWPVCHSWTGASSVEAEGKPISITQDTLVLENTHSKDAVQSLDCIHSSNVRSTSNDQEQEEVTKLSASLPTEATSTSLPMMTAGNAVFKYWKSGFNYRDPVLYILMEDIRVEPDVAEMHGVRIVVSRGHEGSKVYGQLVDLVLNLVEEWYPSLLCPWAAEQGLEQRSICYQCLAEGRSDLHIFRMESLKQYIMSCTTHVPCPKGHEVALADLVPDWMLVDIDQRYLLEASEIIFEGDDCQQLGVGDFGVFHGQYKKQPVTVKTFQTQNCLDALNKLRVEAQALQTSHHPSLVCMVGVSIFPQPSLVTEEAPLGSLDGPLIKHSAPISRVVLFKLASQIASALKFLHGLSFIYRNLKAANVLLWSLDINHIVNCKLADFSITTHAAPIGVKGTRGTPGFIAPEVAYVGRNHNGSTYDFKADVFSYGMVLYQMITRHNPNYSIKAKHFEQGKRPRIVDFPVAHTGFHFLTGLMKRCWKHRPTDRPATDVILAQLAKPSVKLIMGVHPIDGDYSLQTACCYISKPSLQPVAAPTPATLTDSLDPPNVELWLCCDSDKGAEITVYQADNMAILRQNMIKDNHIRCMAVCGDNVWVASRGLEFGQLDIFSASTRQPVHRIRMKNTPVSCITCSDTHVYIATMEGYIFMYELTLNAIRSTDKPTQCYTTEHCINGLIVSSTSLWVSHTRHLLFCDPKNLKTTSSALLPDDIPGYVGHLTLSNNKSLVWSAEIGGHILCVWQTLQQTIKFTIDVGPAMLKVEPATQPNDCIITAVCSALDTVWCGMVTGHILVFSEEQEFLLHFRPYLKYIRFLLPITSTGPCLSEECMVVSGGKKYIKNEYLEDVSDNARESDTAKKPKEDSPSESGTVIVWEALRACYMHQVRILAKGDTWTSHGNVQRCEQEWEESKRRMGQSFSSLSCSSKNGEVASSSQIATSRCISTSENVWECDPTSKTEDSISVVFHDGQSLLVVCQKPVLLEKLQEDVRTQGGITGSVSLLWRNKHGTVEELSNQDQLDKYLALQDRPHIWIS